MSVSTGPNRGLMINALTGDTFDTSFRAFLRAIDALLVLSTKSKTLTAPPGSPTNGDRYIVGAGATGAWATHDNAIAVWTTDNPSAPSGEWEFYAATVGMISFNVADLVVYKWTGTSWDPIYDKPFDPSLFVPGLPAAGATLLRFVFTRAVTFPISLTGSFAGCGVASTGSKSFTLNKNGSSIGSVNIAAAATVATFTFSAGVSFAAGDILTVVAPTPQDATLADFFMTLLGTRV